MAVPGFDEVSDVIGFFFPTIVMLQSLPSHGGNFKAAFVLLASALRLRDEQAGTPKKMAAKPRRWNTSRCGCPADWRTTNPNRLTPGNLGPSQPDNRKIVRGNQTSPTTRPR